MDFSFQITDEARNVLVAVIRSDLEKFERTRDVQHGLNAWVNAADDEKLRDYVRSQLEIPMGELEKLDLIRKKRRHNNPVYVNYQFLAGMYVTDGVEQENLRFFYRDFKGILNSNAQIHLETILDLYAQVIHELYPKSALYEWSFQMIDLLRKQSSSSDLEKHQIKRADISPQDNMQGLFSYTISQLIQ
ncbi:MAG: hypothetical protein AAGM67_08550, partial [Bacteroidota bacterium]